MRPHAQVGVTKPAVLEVELSIEKSDHFEISELHETRCASGDLVLIDQFRFTRAAGTDKSSWQPSS